MEQNKPGGSSRFLLPSQPHALCCHLSAHVSRWTGQGHDAKPALRARPGATPSTAAWVLSRPRETTPSRASRSGTGVGAGPASGLTGTVTRLCDSVCKSGSDCGFGTALQPTAQSSDDHGVVSRSSLTCPPRPCPRLAVLPLGLSSQDQGSGDDCPRPVAAGWAGRKGLSGLTALLSAWTPPSQPPPLPSSPLPSMEPYTSPTSGSFLQEAPSASQCSGRLSSTQYPARATGSWVLPPGEQEPPGRAGERSVNAGAHAP